MKYNILDLFSGIGGFSLAMQRAGIEIDKHYTSEVDKYAEQIYKRQFPRSIRLGDVTKIGNEHGKIDLITGGFPCQSFSIAGKRGGFEDTRGTLFFEIERLARFYKPSYMVLENVKGLFSHDGGNTVRVILDKLRRLDYSVQLILCNTVDFGIPQNRERVFFICTARGKRKPEISGIRERKTETIKLDELTTGQSQGYRVYDPKGSSVTLAGEAGGVGAKTGLYAFVKNGENMELRENANCLDANYYKGLDAHQQRTGVMAVCTPDIKVKNQNGRIIKDPDDPMFTLSVRDRHGIYDGTIIRRLTPVECERLQDYKDNWTQYGINEKGEQVEISDTQRYKTLGNSITVKVAEEIFKTIKEVL